MHLLCVSCISINSLFQKYYSMRKGGLEVLSTVPLTFQSPSFSTPCSFLIPHILFPLCPLYEVERTDIANPTWWNEMFQRPKFQSGTMWDKATQMPWLLNGLTSGPLYSLVNCFVCEPGSRVSQADSEHIMQLQMTTNLWWSWASCWRAWITFCSYLFIFNGVLEIKSGASCMLGKRWSNWPQPSFSTGTFWKQLWES